MSTKHLTPEEEYFAREELAKLKKLTEEKREALAKEEQEKLKTLHWMHCAKCGHDLHPVLFRGFTLDKCFNCEGIYLDKEEFEKLAGHESGLMSAVMSLFQR